MDNNLFGLSTYKTVKRKANEFNKEYKSILIKFILIIILIFSYIITFKLNKTKKLKLENIKYVLNYSLQYDEFNEDINEQYIQLQEHFCKNENDNINQEYENKITIAKVDFNNKSYNMFVYKINDVVSSRILNLHNWEQEKTKKILNALDYYCHKKNLKNNDIYVIDIGGNVGWYTYYLGKWGYKIISFEASKINSYILYKNYCLNKDVNVTIIPKGLNEEEKICQLQTQNNNFGNGMIVCEKKYKNIYKFTGDIYNNIIMTKLSNYFKFLSKKNVALMKLDIEGFEPKAIYGGKELITKYHTPFVVSELAVDLSYAFGTNKLEFFQFFEDNGYKISLNGFFSKQYLSPLELSKIKKTTNYYFVYEKILE